MRDSAGRIVTKTETLSGTGTGFVYNYDAMGRLLTVTEDGTLVEEYRYDAAGTRNYEMNTLRNITRNSITYRADDGLLNTGDATYQHDADGFLLTKTVGTDVTAYDYSSRGELLSVILHQGTAQHKLIEYIHDPLGRRIAKKVDNVIVEKYLWQGMTRLLAVYDGNNNLLMRFEYADARMPFAIATGSGTYFLAYDQVGSLRVVADGSGAVVKRIDYDSFGNVISDSDPNFAVPFGFAGGLHDRDTGLVRFGFRDYDPDTGRWTAKDPIGFAGGDSDLYGYCVNDPVNFVDSWGLSEADVEQIKDIFRKTVDKMTKEGKRHPWPRWNNFSSTFGSGYLGCGEQAEVVVGELQKGKYDDKWLFMDKQGFTDLMLPHQWVEAESTNPGDPNLIIDPWKNEIMEK